MRNEGEGSIYPVAASRAGARSVLSILLLLAVTCSAATAGCGADDPGEAPVLDGSTVDTGQTSPPDRPAPDMPSCLPNNDGAIAADEVTFVPGAVVSVRRNKPGTTVKVDHAGTQGPDGARVWDLTRAPADTRATVRTLSPGGRWFSTTFPKATFLVPTTVEGFTGTVYQVLEMGGAELRLLGVASEKETPLAEKALITYAVPVPLLCFPLTPGKEWVATAKATGSMRGLPFSSTDRYHVRVLARGAVVLPDIRFETSLKVVTSVEQRLLGGVVRRLQQVLFLHECFGEIVRIESRPGEADPGFQQASLLRFISF